jgi:hypothetical protein
MSGSIAEIGNEMFEFLAHNYPISCASDEFYYFPQFRLAEPQWDIWDRFSAESAAESGRFLSTCEHKLDNLASGNLDLQEQIDVRLLKEYARTLREQLLEVRSWEAQPSFHLTLACIGLAEAMESDDPAARHERAETLPEFLDRASGNLANVPVLFRDIGLEMIKDTRDYFVLLGRIMPEMPLVLDALDRFEENLRRVDTREGFNLPPDLLERVIYGHIGTGLDIRSIQRELDAETEGVLVVLEREARRYEAANLVNKGEHRNWSDIYSAIPGLSVDSESVISLFNGEVNMIAAHCLQHGLVKQSLLSSCPVSVEPMPEFLSAIRVGASYSIPPRHPPRGGKFYLYTGHVAGTPGALREYRMTCAHETYPGHHLLDASRWSMERPLRRFMETPIFYEGWACFAEELMRFTGYFIHEADGLILARRRFSHAVRSKVDLGLQTGTMDLSTAVGYLEKAGANRERARLMARKYTLNPGYQLCYTLGLRRFLDLYHRYGRNDLPAFVQTVLGQGEIGFSDLETLLGLLDN